MKHLKKTSIQIFLLALMMRAIFFAAGLVHGEESFAPRINEDAGQYVALAESIIAGRGFTRDAVPPYSPEYFRTPGYPAFLAVIFAVYSHLWLAVFIQIIISALSPVLLYNLSRRFFSGRFAALPAIFIAIEPATLYWSVQLTTEILFTFILLAAITLLLKCVDSFSRAKALFVGLVLGAAMLVRPSGIVILPLALAAPFFLIRQNLRRSLIAAALFVAGISAITIPWNIRNKAIFNHFEFSPVGNIIGFGKYLGWYINLRHGLTLAQVYPEIDAIKDGNPFEYGHALRKKTFSTFFKDPLPYLGMAGGSLMPFFFGDGWNTTWHYLTGESAQAGGKWLGSFRELIFNPYKYGVRGSLFWVGKAVWIITISLATAGFIAVIFRGNEHRRHFILFGLIIIFFALSSGVTSYSRFRQPVNPYIFMLFIIGLQKFIPRRFSKPR